MTQKTPRSNIFKLLCNSANTQSIQSCISTFGVISLSLLFFILLAGTTSAPVGNWTIDGDSVYINDSKAYISASPHTIHESQWVYFNISAKNYTGDVDISFGFDTDKVKPKSAELYKNQSVQLPDTYTGKIFYFVTNITASSLTPDYGHEYNTIHRRIEHKQIVGYNNSTNATIWGNFTSIVAFDSYTQSGSNYTLNWSTRNYQNTTWTSIADRFDSINWDYDGFNKWYYSTNLPVVAGNYYNLRVWVELPVSLTPTNGKYGFALKPSFQTLEQAKNAGNLYYLDPWYNGTWGVATGGNISYIGNYTVHTFSSNDTFTSLIPNLSVDYLIVGGGGGGGYAGAGGGGGLIQGTGYNVTGSVNVVVGTGGLRGAYSDTAGQKGNNSSFGTLIANGGGAGGNNNGAGNLNGGSGGGGGIGSGACNAGTATPAGQGNNGGVGDCASPYLGGGGGGGSGDVGVSGAANIPNGGAGTASSISGASLYYAGGGGGAGYTGHVGGSGGSSIGGIGKMGSNNDGNMGGDAVANTGSGGGGAFAGGGSGSKGIVIVRYLTINATVPPTPVITSVTQGNFWINKTWTAGVGNKTDSYNVSVNGTWSNGTTALFTNTTLAAHGWKNITVYAWNNSGTLSAAALTNNTQIPNNLPGAPTFTSNLTMNEINHTPAVNFTKGTDADGDTVTTYIYVDSSNPPTTQETTTTGSSANIGSTTTLTDGQTYYVRALSWDGYNWSNYSAIDTFRMNSKPSVPALSSPPNNQTISTSTVNLLWVLSTDAENDSLTYDWQVNNTTQGTGLVGLTANKTLPAGIHNWSSRAYDGYEYSSWASVWNFIISSNNAAFNFTNKTLSETQIYQSSQATLIKVDVNDSDGTITGVNVTITYLTIPYILPMINQGGDTWAYSFRSSAPGTYTISSFNATDNSSGTNSTTWGQTFTVVPVKPGGNDRVPTNTPTHTATPAVNGSFPLTIAPNQTFNPIDPRGMAQEKTGKNILYSGMIAGFFMIGLSTDKRKEHKDLGLIGLMVIAISLYGLGVVIP